MAWKITQSPLCTRLWVAPGNAGTSQLATNVAIGPLEFEKLGQLCIDHAIELVVVGPEVPLVKGIRDYFESVPALRSVLMVGPGAAGARLEGSKDFSKQFMLRHGIPTAAARTFQDHQLAEALSYLETCRLPIVLKADGLAAGKGVLICSTIEEARSGMTSMLGDKLFGDASARVLVEEFLSGIELSVFVLTDGSDYVLLPEAKDYKRIGEGDTGLNTGGMGAVSPVVFADETFMTKIRTRIIRPTIEALSKEGIPYKGFIFFGLINVDGEPYVIEYNARMGDPETEAVMTRIKGDLVEALVATAGGNLGKLKLDFYSHHAVTVMMVAGGYPGDYAKGYPINGLGQDHPAVVFHAGTRQKGTEVVTDGGRVIAVTGNGASLEQARQAAFQAASAIEWDGVYFRKDIGLDLQKLSTNS